MRILILSLLLALSFTETVHAQAMTSPSRPDSMQALIDIMKDDTLRDQLIHKLEEVRGGHDEKRPLGEAEKPPAKQDEVFSDKGLVTGLLDWVREMGGRLPTAALGAPIDQKVAQAADQIDDRLSAPGASDQIRDFFVRWLPGYLLGTLVAIGVFALIRRRVRARVSSASPMRQVVKDVALRSGLVLLPILACVLVVTVWMVSLGIVGTSSAIYFVLSMPFVIALGAYGLTSSLLLLLAPAKGWKLVAYAQRRLAPAIGILMAVATWATIMLVPELREVVGPAVADVAKLVLDLCVPIVALVIILSNRRVVRAFIVRGHAPKADSGPVDRAIYNVGNEWHRLGIAFVVLNVGARLFGAQTGGFLTQSFLSVAIIIVALVLSTTLRRVREEKPIQPTRSARARKVGIGTMVIDRSKSIGSAVLQVVVALVAVVWCLDLWGIDLLAWAASPTGVSVLGPLIAIGIVVLTTWTIWVVLDAWINYALSPDRAANGRQRSARIMTLLPLLRNFAFVALCVLTIMGVLSNLGINIAPLIAGAGVVGLAIGFGSQQLVQDVITGLFILLEDTIAIGDTINTGDRSGTVEALTIRTVKVRDGDGSLHSIPFSTIKALKNSSRGFGVYTVSVTLDMDANVERAVAVMKEAGEAVRKDPKFAPKMIGAFDVSGIDQIGLDGIVVKGSVKTRALQQGGVGNELNRLVHEGLRRAGIPLARRGAALSPEATV